jgi:hypothetical protein
VLVGEPGGSEKYATIVSRREVGAAGPTIFASLNPGLPSNESTSKSFMISRPFENLLVVPAE